MYILMNFLKISAIIFVVNIIIALVSNTREEGSNNFVKLPRVYLIIFIICYLLFHLPIIAYVETNDYSRPEMIILFSMVTIICLLMIISCINWKIEFGDEVFKYRTIFRHSIVFYYSDISRIKRLKIGSILLKTKKRWLIIDQNAVGRDEFLFKVNKVFK